MAVPAREPVLVTGTGLFATGLSSLADLLAATTAHPAAKVGAPAETTAHPAANVAAPADPAAVLGRRGTRYLDRATRLALVAADRAIADAGLPRDGSGPPRFGVVVSSNLGNLDTVCRVTETIARDGVAATSPLHLPNASGNVIASRLAIRYRLRGPNLTLSDGECSGLDALHWAQTLIHAGRMPGALVVGVEAATDPVRRLLGGRRLFDGAVAVLLEPAGAAEAAGRRPGPDGVPHRTVLGRYARAGDRAGCVHRLPGADRARRWLAPDAPPGIRALDLAAAVGESSGALGVLQCATAAGWLAGQPEPVLALAGTDPVAGFSFHRWIPGPPGPVPEGAAAG